MITSPAPVMWWNGSIVPWATATVHVTSETASRGTNVFEGVRAYWQGDRERFQVVALSEHLGRLSRSARVLCLPVDHLLPALENGVYRVIEELGHRGHLYLRPTVYLERGSAMASVADLEVGAYISGRLVEERSERAMSCVTSTWLRIPDISLPPLAKIGAAYTAFRLARMEAAAAGADEAILLNERGLVAETGGAAVFVVRRSRVYTPPLCDGILDGITRRIAIELLTGQLGIEVVERSIARSELYVADEVFVCGTLDEIRPVASVDGRALPAAPGELTHALRVLYLDLCEGRRKGDSIWWLQDSPAGVGSAGCV